MFIGTITIDRVRAWQLVVAATTVTALVAAGMGVASALRRWFAQTIGRRRDRYGRLARLGTNAQLSFFTATLGSPPALRRTVVGVITSLPDRPGDTSASSAYAARLALFMHALRPVIAEFEEEGQGLETEEEIQLIRTEVELSEVVWIDRDYYVQALVDHDETVHAYSVTTRSGRFHPKLEAPSPLPWRERRRVRRQLGMSEDELRLFRIRLGKSTFSEIGEPTQAYASLGAHRYAYVEAHWFGNPTAYQHYVFSSNDSGAGAWPKLHILFPEGTGSLRWPASAGEGPVDDNALARFRRESVMNTYTVIGPRFQLDDYPLSFGPEIDLVRTLP